jgi:hypothetical protein
MHKAQFRICIKYMMALSKLQNKIYENIKKNILDFTKKVSEWVSEETFYWIF